MIAKERTRGGREESEGVLGTTSFSKLAGQLTILWNDSSLPDTFRKWGNRMVSNFREKILCEVHDTIECRARTYARTFCLIVCRGRKDHPCG